MDADEEWMANYEDVLSTISDKLRNDDWSKLYDLVDDIDGCGLEIETLEDFTDIIEIALDDSGGTPIHFALKSVE